MEDGGKRREFHSVDGFVVAVVDKGTFGAEFPGRFIGYETECAVVGFAGVGSDVYEVGA